MTTEELAEELRDIWTCTCKYCRNDRNTQCEDAGFLRVAAHVEDREQKLREALEKYGGHAQNCDSLHEKHFGSSLECTCGFDTAKKELLK